MAERLVEIPVQRFVRDKLKEMKKGNSYSDFLLKIMESEIDK